VDLGSQDNKGPAIRRPPFSDGEVLPGTSPQPSGEALIPEKAALIRQFFAFSRRSRIAAMSSIWRADLPQDRTLIAVNEWNTVFADLFPSERLIFPSEETCIPREPPS
jgi:hypothetical protein